MSRKDDREWIVKLLYQHDVNEIGKDSLNEILEEHKIKSSFVRKSVLSIINNKDKIDDIISDNMTYKRLDNLLQIERAILRVSVNEFVIEKSVPTSVSINEAVEIAKSYGSDDSYRVINAILSQIAKEF